MCVSGCSAVQSVAALSHTLQSETRVYGCHQFHVKKGSGVQPQGVVEHCVVLSVGGNEVGRGTEAWWFVRIGLKQKFGTSRGERGVVENPKYVNRACGWS